MGREQWVGELNYFYFSLLFSVDFCRPGQEAYNLLMEKREIKTWTLRDKLPLPIALPPPLLFLSWIVVDKEISELSFYLYVSRAVN